MNLRKILIVDRQFQYSFILKNLALLLLAFAMLFGVIKVWEKYQVSQGFLLRPPENSEVVAWARVNNVEVGSAEFMRQFIQRAKVYTYFDLLWKPLAVVLAVNIIILIIANVYYSHRIAGPIYRLKMVLERKMRGEKVEPVYFRKGDAFQELADTVNRLFEKQDNKV